MQMKLNRRFAKIALLGVLLGLGQSAWAGLVVLGGSVDEGPANPWPYDSSAWGAYVGPTAVDGPGWFSSLSGGYADADVEVTNTPDADWTKYLASPSSDPGVTLTLFETMTYLNGDTVGDVNIVGWNMVILTPGWEFANNNGAAGISAPPTAIDIIDGAGASDGIRAGSGNQIYDFVFETASPQGLGANFRIGVDLVWTGAGGASFGSDIQIVQAACLTVEDPANGIACTASNTPTPPTPEAPIPGTPALLAIGLIGMGLRRRGSR